MTKRASKAERWALITGGRMRPLVPSEAAEVALLADLLAEPSAWAEPRPSLEEEVVQLVVDAGPSLHVATQPQQITRRPSRRFAMAGGAALAAAAIVVVALFAGVLVGQHDQRFAFDARLEATALAPGAHASVGVMHTPAGFRVVLEAHELAPLPDGQYYEAWLKSADGTGVPIGTFSSGKDYVTLWAGASPEDYPMMSVTIEAADNNQASSGRAVLVGQLHAV